MPFLGIEAPGFCDRLHNSTDGAYIQTFYRSIRTDAENERRRFELEFREQLGPDWQPNSDRISSIVPEDDESFSTPFAADDDHVLVAEIVDVDPCDLGRAQSATVQKLQNDPIPLGACGWHFSI